MHKGWMRWWCMALLLSVLGCAGQPVPAPEPAPAPVSVPEPPPVPAPAPQPIALPRVAIVVSADIPAYTDIASRLEHSLGKRAARYPLDSHTREALQQSGADQMVAIGLEAALLAQSMPRGRDVVFCQVFNYMDHGLLGAGSRGVGMLPSYDKTFATWRVLAPELRQVAVFTGPGLETLLSPAVAAAERHGINLVHRSISSDKEFLYQYKRMSARLDGLWLLPDNRVLSRNTIQELMSFSLRNGKQVAVFSEQLLRIGGLFSATSDPDEVAAKVLQSLADSHVSGTSDSSGLLFLEQAELHVNPVIAQRLGLTIPESLRPHVAD